MKPTYYLTWTRGYAFSKGVRLHSKEGHYSIIPVKGGKFRVERSHTAEPGGSWVSAEVDSEEQAKHVALEHDWTFIRRNFLVTKAPGVFEAADGRITVKRLKVDELRAVMPHGHTSTKAGYAIFVDGKYRDCGYSLRSVQHSISNTKRFADVGESVQTAVAS
jgi:hypothetical protein